jgi:hypothetical protein
MNILWPPCDAGVMRRMDGNGPQEAIRGSMAIKPRQG